MQAIVRVNRVYGEKPGGLIVDLIGLADPLADGAENVCQCDRARRQADPGVQDEAIPAMRSAFEQLEGFFYGFDYKPALNAQPVNVLRVYLGRDRSCAGRWAERGRRDGLEEVPGDGQETVDRLCLGCTPRGDKRDHAASGVLPARSGDDP